MNLLLSETVSTSIATHHPRARSLVEVEQALVSGGDRRLTLRNGVNAYGNGPRPDSALIALGSSTASVISVPAMRAAARLHGRVAGSIEAHRLAVQHARERIANLSGAALVPGTEMVMAASGTDVHRIAAWIAQDASTTMAVVMADPSETGSGVPAAVSGNQHPAVTIALRDEEGRPRDAAEVDADFTAWAQRAVAESGRCLLVAADVSKTGLRAPSLGCLRLLHGMLGDRLTVLVDACQMRLSPQAVATYLRSGCMVAITGSKFIGGPAFCGALLLPAALAEAVSRRPLEPLRAETSRLDWPAGWKTARALDEQPNIGLLMRWEAALDEWQRFVALPTGFAQDFLTAWSEAVAVRIAVSPWLEALAVPSASQAQTLHTFTIRVRGASGFDRPMPPEQVAALYRRMRHSEGSTVVSRARVQLGQPVACGQRHGMPAHALRLCAGARTVTQAAERVNGLRHAVTQATRAIDKIEWLAARLA